MDEGVLLPFSPCRCDVMSDKRQRARVQGSWAKQLPKHSGPTGNLKVNVVHCCFGIIIIIYIFTSL